MRPVISPGSSRRSRWRERPFANKVRRARLENVLGSHGTENVQGEVQQKLDVIANEVLLRCLGERASIAVLASEENEEPLILQQRTGGWQVLRALRPPGWFKQPGRRGGGPARSSPCFRNDPETPGAEDTVCQTGLKQVAAGYILYGSSTILVLTTGHGVDMFVLDQAIGSFLHVKNGSADPTRQQDLFHQRGVCRAVSRPAIEPTCSGRMNRATRAATSDPWSPTSTGSSCGAASSSIPSTRKNPGGKLRLLYEANPMAMVIEQAGGLAFSGAQRTLGSGSRGTARPGPRTPGKPPGSRACSKVSARNKSAAEVQENPPTSLILKSQSPASTHSRRGSAVRSFGR